MKKYLVGAALGAVCAIILTQHAQAKVQIGAQFPHAKLVGAVEAAQGDEQGIYKFNDGSTTCYIVSSAIPGISCVK